MRVNSVLTILLHNLLPQYNREEYCCQKWKKIKDDCRQNVGSTLRLPKSEYREIRLSAIQEECIAHV